MTPSWAARGVGECLSTWRVQVAETQTLARLTLALLQGPIEMTEPQHEQLGRLHLVEARVLAQLPGVDRVLAKERSEAARPACDEGASRKPGGVGGAAPHVEETDQDWAGQAIAPARIGVRSGLIPESAPNPAPDPQSAPDPGAAALANAPGNVGRCRAVTGWRRERWP